MRIAKTFEVTNEAEDMTREIGITELANRLNGTIAGNFDKELRLCGTCAVENYAENKVTFIRKTKYGELLAKLQNAVVLIPESLADLCEEHPQNTYIIVKDILNSIMDVQDFFYGGEIIMRYEGIAATANIDKSAKIGRHVYIGEYVCIGKNVVIGDNTKIMHNVSILDNVALGSGTLIYPGGCIYQGCRIGNDCIIDAGAVIGADGFRYEQFVEQKIVRKMLHVGVVMVGDRVEIGANTAIDRATFEGDATIISDDVKIDNLVHVAHNVKIGPRTVIIAQSCIGGSTKIGEDAWIGIGAAISNGLSIGNRAKVLLNAVVAYDVKDDEIVSGFYAMPHKQWKQIWAKWTEQAR
ncbi:MAG: UDP-3-O-(3-hydroxymyristoyl)glucosamine N-acyltransferase [Dehalococcoidia bacterium]